MISDKSIATLLDTIKGHYHWFQRNNPGVVEGWSRMLKHLSENQIKAAIGRMLAYNGKEAPTPGMFNAWAGGRDSPGKAPEYHTETYTVTFGGLVKEFAVILPGPAKKFNLPIARGVKTWNTRWNDVIRIWAQEIKLPNTLEENIRIFQCDDPLDPGVLTLRNHNRKALGWPLLNTQGRSVSNA